MIDPEPMMYVTPQLKEASPNGPASSMTQTYYYWFAMISATTGPITLNIVSCAAVAVAESV